MTDLVEMFLRLAVECGRVMVMEWLRYRKVPNYRLPVFNLTVNIWRFGNATTNPPDVVASANHARGRRAYSSDASNEPLASALPCTYLLLPSSTDILGGVNTNGSPDTVEVDAFSGRFYTVHYVEYAGQGFPNEHLTAVIVMIPGMGPPLVGGDLLLEDGTPILLEDSTPFLME